MKKAPLVGLLVERLTRLPFYEKLAIENRLRILQFRFTDIDWSSNTVMGWLLTNKGRHKRRSDLPLAIYNRLYSPRETETKRIEKAIGVGKVFNMITQFDKWDIHRILNANGLSEFLPSTYTYTAVDDLVGRLEQHRTLILKPRLGQLGKRIYRVHLLEDGQIAVYHEVALPMLLPKLLFYSFVQTLADPRYFIAQQYISFMQIDHCLFDIRLLMQKNGKGLWELSGTLSRVADADYLVTNLSHKMVDPADLLIEAKLHPDGLLSRLKDISMEVTRQLEQSLGSLGELSVDFGLDSTGHPWIIEVNGKPNKLLFREIANRHHQGLMAKILLQPIAYARFLATQ